MSDKTKAILGVSGIAAAFGGFIAMLWHKEDQAELKLLNDTLSVYKDLAINEKEG